MPLEAYTFFSNFINIFEDFVRRLRISTVLSLQSIYFQLIEELCSDFDRVSIDQDIILLTAWTDAFMLACLLAKFSIVPHADEVLWEHTTINIIHLVASIETNHPAILINVAIVFVVRLAFSPECKVGRAAITPLEVMFIAVIGKTNKVSVTGPIIVDVVV